MPATLTPPCETHHNLEFIFSYIEKINVKKNAKIFLVKFLKHQFKFI